jgi:hypothetical protein
MQESAGIDMAKLQEKRYRSMQEHIRRAHPSHYIPKLPATEESFLLMVNTPLDQRAHLASLPTPSPAKKHGIFSLFACHISALFF